MNAQIDNVQAVFIIFGAITIVWAVTLFYTLPDTPMNARFLSKEDRIKAIERVKDNMTGIKNNHWKKDQVVDALTDPKTWFIFFIGLCCNIPNGGITSVRRYLPIPITLLTLLSSAQSLSKVSVSPL
tara:strand:- start:1130 stop:1510 length:381 start_codon:yes stop_codon:yes gene_type:complete